MCSFKSHKEGVCRYTFVIYYQVNLLKLRIKFIEGVDEKLNEIKNWIAVQERIKLDSKRCFKILNRHSLRINTCCFISF